MAKLIDNSYKLRNQEFLQEYAQKPGVNIMFNGVMYRVLNKGNGPKPSPKSFVTVYYSGISRRAVIHPVISSFRRNVAGLPFWVWSNTFPLMSLPE